jgi:hypothetical protein
MTAQALYRSVSPRKCETGPTVVKDSTGPPACAVASLAIRGKSGRSMIGIRGLSVFSQMATDTLSIQSRVFPIDMAGGAAHVDVCPCQRKSRCRVVELGPNPGRSRVAQRTIAGKACCRMVRVRCTVVTVEVTRRTIGRCASKAVVGMALRTSNSIVA